VIGSYLLTKTLG
jgi:5'-AMP-activated protein kinase catalytic alpha subunit